jgi:hypothetical protein
MEASLRMVTVVVPMVTRLMVDYGRVAGHARADDDGVVPAVIAMVISMVVPVMLVRVMVTVMSAVVSVMAGMAHRHGGCPVQRRSMMRRPRIPVVG